MEEVNAGLEKDVHLGVLERVPENTLHTRCSRMCVTVKKNVSLGRTVDFRSENDAAPR